MGRPFWKSIQNRWFRLSVFAAAFTSGFLWYIMPQSPWWPVVIVVPAVLLLILSNQDRPARLPTAVHVAVLFFLVSAGIGVWTAYQVGPALDKFRVLLGAVLIFYALVYQSRSDVPVLLGVFSVAGSLFAIYFSLTYDWVAHAVDTQVVNRIGAAWMQIRPQVDLPPLVDDIAGGIFAVLLPLAAVLLISGIQLRSRGRTVFGAVTALLIFAGLFLTGLRAAWVGFAVGLALSAAVIVGQRWLLRFSARAFRLTVIALLALAVLGGILLLGILTGELFPGLQSNAAYWSVRGRFSLFRDVFDLSGDVFLIGGGLASFPGIFSRYVLSIFDYYMGYSHNLYLDLVIEQGILGLTSMMVILLVGVWLLVMHRFRPEDHFDGADVVAAGVMLGMFTLLIQGLLENSLHGMRATPILLALPAMSYLVSEPARRVAWGSSDLASRFSPRQQVLAWSGGGLAVLILLGVFFRPLAAQFHANLGANEMAKIELRDWPEIRPDEAIYSGDQLAGAINHFEASLRYQPMNRTANYRMGRIAMEQRDFDAAVPYLERAFEQDQHYHGIRKNLGYSYVFTGQVVRAVPILLPIREAEYEMRLYNWWWGTQGRDDLASYALQYVESIP